MRPKARGLAQHGGSLGWLEESDPTVMDGPFRLPLSVLYRLPWQELLSCELMGFPAFLKIINNKPSVMSCATQGRHWMVLWLSHAFSLALATIHKRRGGGDKPTNNIPLFPLNWLSSRCLHFKTILEKKIRISAVKIWQFSVREEEERKWKIYTIYVVFDHSIVIIL